jgi:peroxiredoxin
MFPYLAGSKSQLTSFAVRHHAPSHGGSPRPGDGKAGVTDAPGDAIGLGRARPADAMRSDKEKDRAMIKVGDKLPSVKLKSRIQGDTKDLTTEDIFAGKKVALFGLPGAFTPTCSAKHLPGYVEHADAIRAKGVDTIACLSVNDAFVMDAWGKDQKVGDKVMMLADGSADFARAVGLELDLTANGMGVRIKRFSMLVENGVVKTLNVEKPGAFEVSDAATILGQA